MIMEGQLKVTPQELVNTSSDFSARGQVVSGLTQEMLALVSGLSGVWEGDASGVYLKKFSELSGDITKINNKVKEHVENLQEMAKRYETAENTHVESNNALSSHLID